MTYRELLCFGFDGVLSQGRSYHWPLTRLDVSPLRQAHERGYACAVMTCNTVPWVVVALWRTGIKATADDYRDNQEWNGGRDGRRVLVTNRKLAAVAYVDDRAITA